jgi:hypothetical protein
MTSVAAVTESERSTPRPRSHDRRLNTFSSVVLVLVVLVVVGCFGTWYQWRAFSFTGMTMWEGPAWPVLVLSVSSFVFLGIAVLRGSSMARVVLATLMASGAVVAGYYVISYLFWVYPPHGSVSIGWGLWLCLACSLAASALSLAWIRAESAASVNVAQAPGS